MKVLITGASGFLGSQVFEQFKNAGHDVRGTAFSNQTKDLLKVDLTDFDDVTDLIALYNPDVVVHTAAERHPDIVEKDPAGTAKLNAALPKLLGELALKYGFALVYISTDYVFDGNAPPAGYEPEDPTGPTNSYGHSKLEGERAVRVAYDEGAKAITLRVPVLYGPTAKGPQDSAVNVLLIATRNTEKQVKMDNWGIRFPTLTTDVARVLVQLGPLAKNAASVPPVLHFSAQQKFTKYEMCKVFAAHLDPPVSIDHLSPVNEGNLPGETPRPRDCHLSNKAIEALGVDTTTVDFEQWWATYLQSSKL